MTTEPTREQVASFLRSLEQGNMAKSIAAECARAWLALHDAPVGEVRAHDELGSELPLVFAPDSFPVAKTVRLVAVD